MPRPTRLNLPDIPQHVTQRGNNRQACFFSNDDYRLYVSLLAKSCRKHQCEIHAYALMTNHVHFLMTPKIPEGVSLVIRDLGRDYVRTINKTRGRSGTMWEGRFKSSLVDKEHYCLICYRYIELNPVRAGMVQRPGEYPWSSFRCNALGEPDSLITPHECWLQLGGTSTDRKRTYLSLFDDVLEQQKINDIRYGIGKGLPTGSETFKSEIERALSVKLGDGKQGRPRNLNKGPDTFFRK
jgi:putative transposase